MLFKEAALGAREKLELPTAIRSESYVVLKKQELKNSSELTLLGSAESKISDDAAMVDCPGYNSASLIVNHDKCDSIFQDQSESAVLITESPTDTALDTIKEEALKNEVKETEEIFSDSSASESPLAASINLSERRNAIIVANFCSDGENCFRVTQTPEFLKSAVSCTKLPGTKNESDDESANKEHGVIVNEKPATGDRNDSETDKNLNEDETSNLEMYSDEPVLLSFGVLSFTPNYEEDAEARSDNNLDSDQVLSDLSIEAIDETQILTSSTPVSDDAENTGQSHEEN